MVGPYRMVLTASRIVTVAWCFVQILVAIVAIRLSSRVVDEVLGIQSFSGRLLLGVFLLSLGSRRLGVGPTTRIVVGVLPLLTVRLFTPVSWQWYVLIGTAVTFVTALLVGRRTTWDTGTLNA